MMPSYKPYSQPYSPSLRARWRNRFSDAWTAIYGHFWGRFQEWFFERLNWRRIDRAATEVLSFFIAVAALYLVCLVAEAVCWIGARGAW